MVVTLCNSAFDPRSDFAIDPAVHLGADLYRGWEFTFGNEFTQVADADGCALAHPLFRYKSFGHDLSPSGNVAAKQIRDLPLVVDDAQKGRSEPVPHLVAIIEELGDQDAQPLQIGEFMKFFVVVATGPATIFVL